MSITFEDDYLEEQREELDRQHEELLRMMAINEADTNYVNPIEEELNRQLGDLVDTVEVEEDTELPVQGRPQVKLESYGDNILFEGVHPDKWWVETGESLEISTLYYSRLNNSTAYSHAADFIIPTEVLKDLSDLGHTYTRIIHKWRKQDNLYYIGPGILGKEDGDKTAWLMIGEIRGLTWVLKINYGWVNCMTKGEKTILTDCIRRLRDNEWEYPITFEFVYGSNDDMTKGMFSKLKTPFKTTTEMRDHFNLFLERYNTHSELW